MEMNSPESEGALTDPPRYDTLHVWFRGDKDPIVLPYCEVANGDITEVNTDKKLVMVKPQGEGKTPVEIPYPDFVKLVYTGFALKEIVKLNLHVKETYELITIL